MTDQATPATPPGSAIQLLSVGVLTAAVGFASAFTIVLQGLAGAGATPAQAASGLLHTVYWPVGDADARFSVVAEVDVVAWRLSEVDFLAWFEGALKVGGDEVFTVAFEVEHAHDGY